MYADSRDYSNIEDRLNEIRNKNTLGNEMRLKFYKFLYKKFGYDNSSIIMSNMKIGSPYWKTANNILRKIAGA